MSAAALVFEKDHSGGGGAGVGGGDRSLLKLPITGMLAMRKDPTKVTTRDYKELMTRVANEHENFCYENRLIYVEIIK